MKQRVNRRDEDQGDEGGAGEAAHHGASQGSLGVGPFADPEGQGQECDDGGQGRHQNRPEPPPAAKPRLPGGPCRPRSLQSAGCKPPRSESRPRPPAARARSPSVPLSSSGCHLPPPLPRPSPARGPPPPAHPVPDGIKTEIFKISASGRLVKRFMAPAAPPPISFRTPPGIRHSPPRPSRQRG